MQWIRDEIERLIECNARHRAGWRLADSDPVEMLKHAAGELIELAMTPDDPGEVADIFCILLHYAMLRGWSQDRLERECWRKLQERFDDGTGDADRMGTPHA